MGQKTTVVRNQNPTKHFINTSGRTTSPAVGAKPSLTAILRDYYVYRTRGWLKDGDGDGSDVEIDPDELDCRDYG